MIKPKPVDRKTTQDVEFKNSLEALLANRGPNPYLRRQTTKEPSLAEREKIKMNIFDEVNEEDD